MMRAICLSIIFSSLCSAAVPIVAPSAQPTNGQVLVFQNNLWVPTTLTTGSGTVTSVGLTAPSILTVTGSPVNTSGTLALTLTAQAQKTFLAGPTSGANATPTFRAITATDLPGNFAGFADPTGVIGVFSNIGSLSTAMRSDASPALDLSIAPSWTGKHTFLPSKTAASGVFPLFSINPTIIESGTAGYWGLDINVTETSVGSGAHLLQQWRLGGVQKASMDNAGNFIAVGTVAGSNLTGTNTGDQTITLTGDVTGSGTGSFAASIGAGRVTNTMLAGSIAASNLIGSDIATVGTITAGTWSGTVIGSTKGGAGAVNGILKANGSGTVSAAVSGTDYQAAGVAITALTGDVTASGPGSVAATIGAARVTNSMLAGSIDALTKLTNAVPIANGGTGQATANAGFNALSPFTTLGDTLYGGTSGAGTRVAGNTSSTKQFFTQTGTGTVSAAPVWTTIQPGDLPNHSAALLTSGLVSLARGGANADLSATGGTGQYLKQSGAGSSITVGTIATADLPGSFSGFGNPAGTVGLTAVNGSATTAMRSDGAPAISQSISPTWSAQHQFSAGILVGGAANDANHAETIKSMDNTSNHGLKLLSNNTLAQMELGYSAIITNSFLNIAAGSANSLAIGGNNATQLTMTGSMGQFSVPISVSQSATAVATASNGTITANTIGVSRVSPAGAITGVILEAGTQGGQIVTVLNEAIAANSVTFAVSGTSHVADGTGDVIAGLTARRFVYDSATSLWYPCK